MTMWQCTSNKNHGPFTADECAVQSFDGLHAESAKPIGRFERFACPICVGLGLNGFVRVYLPKDKFVAPEGK